MVDEFDPLKNLPTKTTDQSTGLSTKIDIIPDDDDLLRPNFEPILRIQQNSTSGNASSSTNASKSSETIYDRLSFKNDSAKVSMRQKDTADDIFHSVSSSEKTDDQRAQKTNESQGSEHDWDDEGQSQHDQDADSTGYLYVQNDTYGVLPANGLVSALDRLVERFPALGIFYKSTTPVSTIAYPQEEVEQQNEDEPPQLVDTDQWAREITPDELALIDRYSNKLRTQIIDLQKKDQTQPVDVAVHHESHTFYVCDVGRSIVEIFNFDGSLEHVIDDANITKFQPSTIAVAHDGTIFLGSTTRHQIQMYCPMVAEQEPNENNTNADENFYYQQFKLGSPDSNLHQFSKPYGLAIDNTDGYLYICDRGNFCIKVMRPEGVCERTIELMVSDEHPYYCAPIEVVHQNLSNQLVCLIGSGDAICFVPKSATGPTEVEVLQIIDNAGVGLHGAKGLAVDDQDRIFIADTENHRIVICTPEGYYINHFGCEGAEPGQLRRPHGLAITNDGTIAVADSGNKRLQLFGCMREQVPATENTVAKETV